MPDPTPRVFTIIYTATALHIVDDTQAVHGTFFERDPFGESNYWTPATLERCEDLKNELEAQEDEDQERQQRELDERGECFYCGANIEPVQLYCGRDCRIMDADTK